MRRVCFGLGLFVLLACSSRHDRPPYYEPPEGTGGSGYQITKETSCATEALPDAGLCGNQTIDIQQDRPNLYFVLDASGSMGDPIGPGPKDPIKYEMAVTAIADVLKVIGHRVSYGAAIFPKPAKNSCIEGMQIFDTRPGDPVTCSMSGRAGPVLANFIDNFRSYKPAGGTPLSATLRSLLPTLTGLGGKTAVILATDGDPNCNPDATCSAGMCETNLLHRQSQDGVLCEEPVNCCDPDVDPEGPKNCVDDVATNDVLSTLRAASIPTFVIGLPSQNLLSAVLDSMAIAGGTARDGWPRYYEAGDADSLAKTLKTIATSLAVSCTVKLAQDPPTWPEVAVYFDGKRIPAFTDDGWQPIDASTLQITGSYCDDLMTGEVMRVQIIADCPTYVN